jgi:hypothetical protein
MFRSHFASHKFEAILGMASSMLEKIAKEYVMPYDTAGLKRKRQAEAILLQQSKIHIVITDVDPTDAVDMKWKRWKGLCHPDWVYKRPLTHDRYQEFNGDADSSSRSYPGDRMKHWCHSTYHHLVPSYRQQAMMKWFSEMPNVETEPGVVSVCPLALLKQKHDPAWLGYSVGNVEVYDELRFKFWRQGITTKRYVIMSQFWLPELDTTGMSRRMRIHMERERRELVPIGPWTQELTMVFLWGREPVLQSYTKDDCWWPIYPWHPNHKNRVQYEWAPALRRYKTLGE